METIKYRVENCLEQGKRIKEEYPTIKEVTFELADLNYFKLKEFADNNGRKITLHDNDTIGLICVYKDNTTVFLRTAKLIVEQVVTMEE